MASVDSLGGLRRRLTAWYVATFGAILVLLGAGLFVTIRHQYAAQLDASLRDATTELQRAARIREMEAGSGERVMDAVDELHIPDRALYLLDTAGVPVKPDSAAAWIRAEARRAAAMRVADAEHELPDETTLRLHAERFALASGAPLVAVAVADKVELADRYASLIGAFGAAAAFALVLVAAGSWLLVRKSTTPIERSIAHMRRFMADAAHELRTPITVMRSRAEVALQQVRDAGSYASAIRAMEAETVRLGGIVEDLLTLARADAGERPIERTRVYLDDVALDAAGTAHVVATARGVTLEVNEFEEAVVDGDAALLRQLAMLLLDNAIKFTPPGGRVSVRVGSASGRPSLEVADTGVGIAADHLPHIFERFYRADPSRSRGAAAYPNEGDGGAAKGAGLGLSIARWIVDAHGADIQVSSQPDVGTRVTVSFPPAAIAAL